MVGLLWGGFSLKCAFSHRLDTARTLLRRPVGGGVCWAWTRGPGGAGSRVLSQPFPSCASLGKLLSFSVPQRLSRRRSAAGLRG